MQILSFETLEGPHGEETFMKCDHCGRKIKHVAHTTEGTWGIKCAKTAIAEQTADEALKIASHADRSALVRKAGFDDWMDLLKHIKAAGKKYK